MRFSFWQAAFFLAGAAFLTVGGLARLAGRYRSQWPEVCSASCFGAAGLAGREVGRGSVWGSWERQGLLAGCVVGGGLGVGLLVIVGLFGAALFKRTDHQRFGAIHVLWGMGGAFFGLLIGLAVLGASFCALLGFGVSGQTLIRRPLHGQSGARPLSRSQGSSRRAAASLVSIAPVHPGFYEPGASDWKSDQRSENPWRAFSNIREFRNSLQIPRIVPWRTTRLSSEHRRSEICSCFLTMKRWLRLSQTRLSPNNSGKSICGKP